MYDIKQIFAYNIKRLRKNRQLTQEQFAEKIKMQWKSVVNFEASRNLPNSENLQKICNELNIAPTELFITFNKDESTQQTLNKINIMLNKMNKEKLEEAYRIIAVLNDKSHFID